MLRVPAKAVVKTMLFSVDGKPVAVLVRGDREVNDIKLKNLLKAQEVELAGAATVEALTHAPVGFAGPVGLDVPVYADLELQGATDYVTGANAADAHFRHVDLRRDAAITAWADLRAITPEDVCPRCGGRIELTKGIEVGHIFMLGLKYSESMHAAFLDENGKEKLMIMGCYGIGVSRVAAAAIEQNHDENGIVFPPPVAPFECILLNLDPRNAEVTAKTEEIYAMLRDMGVDVLLDDREERPGVKFKDADLLGAPMQLVVGGKGLARGIVECKDRRSGEKGELSADVIERISPNGLRGAARLGDAAGLIPHGTGCGQRPMQDGILTVRALTEQLRRSLEGRFPFVWVRGEVSNLSRPGSGHIYFSLKDQDAQLQCVWFRGGSSARPSKGRPLIRSPARF